MYTKIELNYDKHNMSDFLSLETFQYHYDVHYNTYINNVNKHLETTQNINKTILELINDNKDINQQLLNNILQVYNHELYFEQFTDTLVNKEELLIYQLIEEQFCSFLNFKNIFEELSNKFFGSGYVVLCVDNNNKLTIQSYNNADNSILHELNTLLIIDLWEHSYYIDYRNDRKRYIENFWKYIDWSVVNNRLINKFL